MGRKRYKIGIITHNYPRNSKERKDAGVFIYDFAHELAKRVEVHIMSPDFSGKKEKYIKVPVRWFDWGGGGKKFGEWKLFSLWSVFNYFKLIYRGTGEVERFIDDNKLDFVLGAWGLPSGVLAYLGTRKNKVKFGIWSLGSDINKYIKIPILRQMMILAYKRADLLFANSYLLCGKIEKIIGKKCFFMPAITDFEVKRVRKVRASKKDDCFKFIFVGRLEKIKGPDILVEAAKLIKKEGHEFKINILGDGTMRMDLEEKVQDWDLVKEINFEGFADKSSVSRFMNISDCLVISSRNESLPLVVLEAARVGLPSISTEVGDCLRLVKKYKSGVCIEKGNVKLLAKAMVGAIKAGKVWRSRFKKGLSMIDRDFTQKNAVGTLLKKM